MKRFQIKQMLILGYIETPDYVTEETVTDYMDSHACWPDDEEVDYVIGVEVIETIPCTQRDKAKHIISEPGGGTHYDYLLIPMLEKDVYTFESVGNTFRYPTRIALSVDQGREDEFISGIAYEQKCNPWTVRECIRGIHEYQKECEPWQV